MGVYKVIPQEQVDEFVLHQGRIPNQPADINNPFIHACDQESIPIIVEKFFKYTHTIAIEINLEAVAREGFIIKYEANRPNGAKYWHFYRPEDTPNKELSQKCVTGMFNAGTGEYVDF